jgi:UTP--glucose-1-phosphate uridylyltransferase
MDTPWLSGRTQVVGKAGSIRVIDIAYGVLHIKNAAPRFNGRFFEIKNMVEKPKPADAPSNLAIIGHCVLTPAIFDTLTKTKTGSGGEIQLTDSMCLLLNKEKIYAYVYEGKRPDQRR